MNEQLSCPNCGYELAPQVPPTLTEPLVPTLTVKQMADFEIHVVSLSGVTLHRPAVTTRNGLYVVGWNEDGQAILTHVPESDA